MSYFGRKLENQTANKNDDGEGQARMFQDRTTTLWRTGLEAICIIYVDPGSENLCEAELKD